MSEFTYTHECLTTSAGDVDVAFDVDFDVVSDETGIEYDWYPSGKVKVIAYDDDGNELVSTFANLSHSFVTEILDLVNPYVLEKCRDNHIDNNDF